MTGLDAATDARSEPHDTQSFWHPPRHPPVARLCAAVSLALALSALGGCNTLGGFTGAAAAVTTGAVTANPAIGIGVGVAVQAGTDAATKYVFRTWQRDEQDRIAATAGRLNVGESQVWSIKHSIPYGNEHGEVRVVELIKTPLADCKRLLFSVIDGDPPKQHIGWYATTACQQGEQWKWADAEPAVERWGNLQ